MQITSNMTGESMQQILRLFTEEKAKRIRDVNNRIAGEQARGSVFSAANHIEGLEYRPGGDPRIISLSDQVVEAIIAHERDAFARGFGMGNARDGDRWAALQRSFLRDIPVADRKAALHTMTDIALRESERIRDAVRQHIPSWSVGQRVSDEILAPILNGTIGFNATV